MVNEYDSKNFKYYHKNALDFFKSTHFLKLLVKLLVPTHAQNNLKQTKMGKFLTNYLVEKPTSFCLNRLERRFSKLVGTMLQKLSRCEVRVLYKGIYLPLNNA